MSRYRFRKCEGIILIYSAMILFFDINPSDPVASQDPGQSLPVAEIKGGLRACRYE